MTKRLIYVATLRLPTEKAHGYQIASMCGAFARAGWDVELWHPRRRHGAIDDDLFTYYSIPQNFVVRTLSNWDVMRLERALGPAGPALVIGHSLVWNLFASARAKKAGADLYYTRDLEAALWLTRRRLPTVYEAHGVPDGVTGRILGRVLASPSLVYVAALTGYIRDELVERGVPEGRIGVHPDAVDPARFADLPDRDECRARLGLPIDGRIVGYVGRFQTLENEKGIPQLIAAVAQLGPGVRLVCVGGPMSAVPHYSQIAASAGLGGAGVSFFDRVPTEEVPLWIKACDVVTIPWPRSRFASFFTSPMKMFEYMAAHVPIVATDLPSLREVLDHGRNAWLVAPDDVDALAGGLRQVLDDPGLALKLAAAAADDVTGYTWDKRADSILAAAAPATRGAS